MKVKVFLTVTNFYVCYSDNTDNPDNPGDQRGQQPSQCSAMPM